ncbi:hypothetical protein JW859_10780 [bacterium]|nr:hypothetical protein [bacterium]
MLFAAVLIGLGGCGSGGWAPAATTAPAQFSLPWPPPVVTRSATELTAEFDGSEWVEKSDNAFDNDTELILPIGANLSWGMYALPDLHADNELISLVLEFTGPADLATGETKLFVGLSNYFNGYWEWHVADPDQPSTLDYVDPADYRNGDGYTYVALVLSGTSQVEIQSVTFVTTGNTLPAPKNLTATAVAVELIELEWDDVPAASGYYVYRSIYADMSNRTRLNSAPLEDSNYADEYIGRGLYYYYYVTARGDSEGPPSNIARVWSHEIEMPAPQNFRVEQENAESFTIAWDWADANPSGGWYIYMDTTPNFHPNSAPGGNENLLINGAARQFQFTNNIEPGQIYYLKMCARSSGDLRGRMTDEISASTTGSWDWSDMHTITTGQPPFKAVIADDKIALAYYSDTSIYLATGLDDSWNSEAVLSGAHDYAQFLDIDYSAPNYIIAGYDASAGDAMAAIGSSGDWTVERIHGDGNTNLFHPESGKYIACAITDTEAAVMHLESNYQTTVPNPRLLVQTRSVEGSAWSSAILSSYAVDPAPELSSSLVYRGGNLYALCANRWSAAVNFYDRDSGWTANDIKHPSITKMHAGLDLEWFDNEWYTTAFDYINQELYIGYGTTTFPWEADKIAGFYHSAGFQARLTVEEPLAAAAWIEQGALRFAFSTNDWASEEVILAGIENPTTNAENCLEIVLLNGELYLIFQDEDTGNINIARGVPPSE